MDRLEFLKNKFPTISSEDFKMLVDIDPTTEKKFLDWLCNIFSKGTEISNKNSSRITETLQKFWDIRSKLKVENRDILKFKSIFDLSYVVLEYIMSEKNSEIDFLQNGVRRIYEDSDWLVVSPFTLEAAVQYGKTTTWCTSGKVGNQFYSHLGQGNLYIFINKNEEEKSAFKKLQLHVVPNIHLNFRNAHNQTFEDCTFWTQNKKLLNVFMGISEFSKLASKKYIFLIDKPTKAEQIQAIEYDWKNISFIKEPCDEAVKSALEESNSSLEFLDLIRVPLTDSQQIIFIEGHEKNLAVLRDRKHKISLDTFKYAAMHIPSSFKYVKDLTEEMQIFIIESNSDCFKFFKNPSENTKKVYVQVNPEGIFDLKEPSEELVISAIVASPKIIEKEKLKFKNINIKKNVIWNVALENEVIFEHIDLEYWFSIEEIQELIEKNIHILKYCTTPIELSEALQKEAIEIDFFLVSFISNLTDSMKKLVDKKKKASEKLESKKQKTKEDLSINFDDLNQFATWYKYIKSDGDSSWNEYEDVNGNVYKVFSELVNGIYEKKYKG